MKGEGGRQREEGGDVSYHSDHLAINVMVGREEGEGEGVKGEGGCCVAVPFVHVFAQQVGVGSQ